MRPAFDDIKHWTVDDLVKQLSKEEFAHKFCPGQFRLIGYHGTTFDDCGVVACEECWFRSKQQVSAGTFIHCTTCQSKRLVREWDFSTNALIRKPSAYDLTLQTSLSQDYGGTFACPACESKFHTTEIREMIVS